MMKNSLKTELLVWLSTFQNNLLRSNLQSFLSSKKIPIKYKLLKTSSKSSVSSANVNTMIAELLEKDIEDKMKSELLTVSLLISKVKKMGQLPLEIETLWNKSELRSKICQTIVNIGYFKKRI